MKKILILSFISIFLIMFISNLFMNVYALSKYGC